MLYRAEGALRGNELYWLMYEYTDIRIITLVNLIMLHLFRSIVDSFTAYRREKPNFKHGNEEKIMILYDPRKLQVNAAIRLLQLQKPLHLPLRTPK